MSAGHGATKAKLPGNKYDEHPVPLQTAGAMLIVLVESENKLANIVAAVIAI